MRSLPLVLTALIVAGTARLDAQLSGATMGSLRPSDRPTVQPSLELRYRSIGPARGGRVTAVTGVPGQPGTFYMGATGGGVWKTLDYGQKTGKGWYRYEPGNRTPLPDAEIDALIAAWRAEIKVRPRAIPDDEIVQRCVYALVNEGARILEEGIALRASDIDVVYLTGYGFPLRTGGPMFHAQQVGLDQVLATMNAFGDNPHADPKFWKPAPLLVEAAKNGRWPK